MGQRSWRLPLLVAAGLLVACEAEQPLNLDVVGADRYLVQCDGIIGTPLFEAQEQRCDGIDNDCDGLVDRLLPSVASCDTGLRGVCRLGRRSCGSDGERCDAPAPSIERLDGLDNDCDGEVDEGISQVASESRVRVWVPPALWDAGMEASVASIAEALDSAGISYELPQRDDGELSSADLAGVAVVVVPGYLSASAVPDGSFAALTSWVAGGGRLVVTRLVGEGTAEDRAMFRLAGVASATWHRSGTAVVLAQDPSFEGLASEEERRIPLATEEPLDLYTYTLESGSSSRSVARFFDDSGADAGAAIVVHEVGAGRVLTLGYDLLDVPVMRCYINCYEPGRDRMVVWLRSVMEEATGGHAVFKHTVPGLEPSALIASHDVDAPDSHNDGAWGRAGAIQMMQMEQEEGSPASWFIQTDYKRGIFNPTTIGELAAAGMTSMGGHSNLHLPWEAMPIGDCSVVQSNYDLDTPTVCGEVDVNLALVRQAAPSATGNIWRSPLLSLSPFQYRVLEAQGVKYDSSIGLGDAGGNFPILGERSAHFPTLYEGAHIVTFPVQAEDGMGFADESGASVRVEIQPATFRRMLLGWTTLLEENAANGAPTVLLVHPSWGQGVGPENLPVKIDAVREMIRRAKGLGVRMSTMNEMGDFWRGRDGVAMRASYSPAQGYSVELTAGDDPAPNFSLAFSETVGEVGCESVNGPCPPLLHSGKRVVFDGRLEPHRAYRLTVRPGVAP